MSVSFFRYGDYQHPDNEVNLVRFEVLNLRSRRQQLYAKLYRMHVSGEIQETTTQGIKDRVDELILAYYFDKKGPAEFWVNGIMTPHRLTNDIGQASMSGVRVVQRSWPHGRPSEWANSRNFTIVLEELQDTTTVTLSDGQTNNGVEPMVLEWQQTIRWVGNTGPLWAMRMTQVDLPRGELVYPFTPETLIQEGSSLGWLGYVAPPGPILGPLLEHMDRRVIDVGTPTHQGLSFAYYPTSWHYEFETNAYTEVFPLPR